MLTTSKKRLDYKKLGETGELTEKQLESEEEANRDNIGEVIWIWTIKLTEEHFNKSRFAIRLTWRKYFTGEVRCLINREINNSWCYKRLYWWKSGGIYVICIRYWW